jgi:homoserine O-acetyltransferase
LDIDCSIQLNTPFALDFTVLQGNVSIKARLVGPENAPVVLALGGISANRHVCDQVTHSQTVAQSGWWRDFAGPGKVLDTQTYRLLSFDFLPGDEDLTTPPLKITPQDQARIARLVCDYFGIEQLHAFVGSSYGGMVALCFGALYPERVKQLIVACAAHRPHPMGTAWRSIQRKIVQFGLETQQPDRALSLARELGMTTYRTPQEFGERFAVTEPALGSPVEEYLETRGQAFIGRMSPQRYLSLSHSIDLHNVDPTQIDVPVTYIGFRQDQLVPIEEIRTLVAQLPQAKECFEFDSIFGHDAFLKEIELMSGVIHRALGN